MRMTMFGSLALAVVLDAALVASVAQPNMPSDAKIGISIDFVRMGGSSKSVQEGSAL
jgi:hypothetical protein